MLPYRKRECVALCQKYADSAAWSSSCCSKIFKHHNKPHIHVYYGDYEASIGLDGELLAGSLPAKQFKIVVGWILFHEEELYKAWNLAVQGEHFDKIKPL